ncbi:MAG: class A beta-lactamase [Actinomycetota bacterium]|nr:class A beta-lactamase [Actinomycetota bacterium]
MIKQSLSRLDFSRREVLRFGLAVPIVAVTSNMFTGGAAHAGTHHLHDEVRGLERRYGATIGLYARNLKTGQCLRHRDNQRFPILSVFKTLAVAAVLRDRDVRGEFLAERVRYRQDEIVENSPITSTHVADGMTVRELCDAALRYSDNTAGNLLLRAIGGPNGLTAFARSIGDHRTELDRWEPDLNDAFPRDQRDTTTPAAIAKSYGRLLVGSGLMPDDQGLLRGWMLDNQTSNERFRAGLPQGWRLADKTGAGDYGTLNDVGVAWDRTGTPLLIAALSRMDRADDKSNNALMSELAALTARAIAW